MKKVLISVTTLFGGGAERVASNWANQLSNLGYDVSLLLYGRCEKEYEISEKIKELSNVEVDKKKIILDEAIKTTGTYIAKVKLYEGITANLKINVLEK